MKLGLGTVQFGLDYGAFNNSGQVPPQECESVLDAAEKAGVEVLDTAAGYGNSEDILGGLKASSRFSIVSKVPLTESATEIESSVLNSVKKLKANSVYGMLFHRADDLLGIDADRRWAALAKLREDGLVQKIGFSAYDVSTAVQILKRYDVDLVQVPINVLDRRFAEGEFVEHVNEFQVEVHARSIFLQGFLLADPLRLSGYLSSYEGQLRAFIATCSSMSMSPLQAAITSVSSLRHVRRYVVGVQNVLQLNELLKISEGAVDFKGFEHLACSDVNLIDPSKWIV